MRTSRIPTPLCFTPRASPSSVILALDGAQALDGVLPWPWVICGAEDPRVRARKRFYKKQASNGCRRGCTISRREVPS